MKIVGSIIISVCIISAWFPQTWNERNEVGYKDEDVTMDGQVDADDRATTWNNRNVVSQVPTGTTAFPVKKEFIEESKD